MDDDVKGIDPDLILGDDPEELEEDELKDTDRLLEENEDDDDEIGEEGSEEDL